MRGDMVHNFVLFAFTGVPQCAAAFRAAAAFVDRVAPPRPVGPAAATGEKGVCSHPSEDSAEAVEGALGGSESNRG